MHIPFSKVENVRKFTEDDEILQKAGILIKDEWHKQQKLVDKDIFPYYKGKDELKC